MADEAPNGTTWRWTEQKDWAALALAEGKTWQYVKDEYSVAHTTLARWVKAPAFQARIDEHIDAVVSEARSILRRNATKAARQMAALVDTGLPIDTVKLAAAKDVLDRVGLKAPEKIDHSGGMTIEVTYADIDD